MSSASNPSGDGGGNDRPSREVAYRLFAAEFDDASFSYSESDEERAPNYVVTPTGARVNRLFAVGVLTEVEAVNDDVLRGRLVDPTGAFVSYAGQYQPDEMAFLDRASPPAFVALSGKARTFQPDDSDRVFTSVRPESMSRVDADTRDRWTVSTAEATLERIGVMAAALQSGVMGEALREALLSQGIDESLATGIPLALDHYGTTPAYLAALRRRAVEALEVVADERDSVQSLDLDPASAGDPETPLAALAADLDLSMAGSEPTEATGTEPVDASSEETAPTEKTQTETTTSEPADATPSASGSARTETVESAAGGDESSSGGTDDSGTETEEVPTFDDAEPTTAAAKESATDTTAGDSSSETAEPAGTTEPPESTEPAEAASASESTSAEPEPESQLEPEPTTPSETGTAEPTPAAATESEAEAADSLDDFDDGSASATSATGSADDGDDLGDFDDDGMYELDESERAEVEEEFGTEFSTGSEVAPAGEADIDVPSVEELETEREEADEGRGDAAAASEPGEPTAASADADDDAAAETGAETEPQEDVDLEAAAVEAMAALDDGDGASREAVVGHVVDEYGVDPGAVEDAIQSALMSGQCYEPTEDSLKAI